MWVFTLRTWMSQSPFFWVLPLKQKNARLLKLHFPLHGDGLLRAPLRSGSFSSLVNNEEEEKGTKPCTSRAQRILIFFFHFRGKCIFTVHQRILWQKQQLPTYRIPKQ